MWEAQSSVVAVAEEVDRDVVPSGHSAMAIGSPDHLGRPGTSALSSSDCSEVLFEDLMGEVDAGLVDSVFPFVVRVAFLLVTGCHPAGDRQGCLACPPEVAVSRAACRKACLDRSAVHSLED